MMKGSHAVDLLELMAQRKLINESPLLEPAFQGRIIGDSPLVWLYLENPEIAQSYRLEWEDVRSRFGWQLDAFPANQVMSPCYAPTVGAEEEHMAKRCFDLDSQEPSRSVALSDPVSIPTGFQPGFQVLTPGGYPPQQFPRVP